MHIPLEKFNEICCKIKERADPEYGLEVHGAFVGAHHRMAIHYLVPNEGAKVIQCYSDEKSFLTLNFDNA